MSNHRKKPTGYAGMFRPRADRQFSKFLSKVVGDEDGGEQPEIPIKTVKLSNTSHPASYQEITLTDTLVGRPALIRLDPLDSNKENLDGDNSEK